MTDIRRVFIDVGPVKSNMIEVPINSPISTVPQVITSAPTSTVQSPGNLFLPIAVIGFIIAATAVFYYQYHQRKKADSTHYIN